MYITDTQDIDKAPTVAVNMKIIERPNIINFLINQNYINQGEVVTEVVWNLPVLKWHIISFLLFNIYIKIKKKHVLSLHLLSCLLQVPQINEAVVPTFNEGSDVVVLF